MRIGVPKETKTHEYRVGLTPASVAELGQSGHEVWVERGAGAGIDFADDAYCQAGACIVDTATAFAADLVVKVKEPSLAECDRLSADQVLFTYLHLANAQPQAHRLMRNGTTAIAYETVEDGEGRLPLLRPMSEVAGRLSVQAGAAALQKEHGGRGVLLGGVTGVAPGKVVILGGGVAGSNAAEMAVGLQADVTILDKSESRLRVLADQFGSAAEVLLASPHNVAEQVCTADLVVGAVLIAGARTPRLVDRALLRQMLPGAVLVDISIDQGGCFASSRATTHDQPTYVDDGVVHYCVSNMPAAVARTSTQALNNVTLPYVLRIANNGWREALAADSGFHKGLNIADGAICHRQVAKALAEGCPSAA